MLNKYIQSNFFLPAIILIILLSTIFFGEKIPINNGAGWDGNLYFNFAHNFHLSQFFSGNDISPYYIHRIFPWLLINIINKIINNHDVYITFIIAKIFMFSTILIALIYTSKIARVLNFTKSQTKYLFIFLFINTCILKFPSYYIFLTEYYALTLIIISIYFYITKSFYKLLLATIFLNFTWPFLLINYYFIYSLIQNKTAYKVAKKIQLHKIHQLIQNIKFKLIIRIFIGIVSILLLLVASRHVSKFTVNNEDNVLRLDRMPYIIGASINLILFIVYFDQITSIMLRYLTDKLKKEITITKSEFKAAFSTMIFFISIQLSSNLLSNANIAGPGNVISFVVYRIFRLSSLPFDIILSSMAYIGFIIPFTILYWKDLKNKIYNLDPPAFILTILCMIFLLNGEARMNIVLWPIITIALVRYTNISQYSNTNLSLIVALIVSRFYLNFNAFEFNQNDFFNFPNQGYFMYFSPWLSWKGWIFVAIIGLILTATAHYTKSKNNSSKAT
jgi:hypothetical protein